MNFIRTRQGRLILKILAVILVIGLVVTIVKINNSIGTKTVGFTAYSIGDLNTTDGKYTSSTSSIYTTAFLKVEELSCVIDENATINYRIFFYDEDKVFVSASSVLTADYDANTLPATAEYCKVVIYSIGNDNINTFDIYGLMRQLKVTVSK